MDSLRILVIDDVALVAECVHFRIGSAAATSPAPHARPYVFWMSIDGLDVPASVRKIQDKINAERINFLVVDRGIADRMEARCESPDRPKKVTSYVRRRDASYKDIVNLLADLSVESRRRIRGLVVYTLDEPEPDSDWFVDATEMTQRIHSGFERLSFVDIIKTRSDIYERSGLKLFYPREGDALQEEARAGDLILYGTVVGEMVWARLERMRFSQQRARRLALRGWFLRNYFLFLAVTAGLGIGVSAAYDLLHGTFNSPWAMLVIAVSLGIVFPVGILLGEPRILLPPNRLDD